MTRKMMNTENDVNQSDIINKIKQWTKEVKISGMFSLINNIIINQHYT